MASLWNDKKTRKVLDRKRYLRDRQERLKRSREYWRRNKAKMKAYQNAYWRTAEGWLVIKKVSWKRNGFSAQEIAKKIKAYKKNPTRKGRVLESHAYTHGVRHSESL